MKVNQQDAIALTARRWMCRMMMLMTNAIACADGVGEASAVRLSSESAERRMASDVLSSGGSEAVSAETSKVEASGSGAVSDALPFSDAAAESSAVSEAAAKSGVLLTGIADNVGRSLIADKTRENRS